MGAKNTNMTRISATSSIHAPYLQTPPSTRLKRFANMPAFSLDAKGHSYHTFPTLGTFGRSVPTKDQPYMHKMHILGPGYPLDTGVSQSLASDASDGGGKNGAHALGKADPVGLRRVEHGGGPKV